MDEADLKRARGNYLFSCGLALIAALTGIAVPAAAEGGFEKPRLELVLVGLGAIAIFVWVVAGMRRGDPEPDTPEMARSTSRLRKMSLLWLGLAAALGVSVVRAPVSALLDGTAAELPALNWLGLAAGLLIAGVALWRIGAAVLRRNRNE
jgi:hypothetical protein